MEKYFGTDGIRGKYGDNLDAALSYKTGLALAAYFGAGDCYIGRDTRVSGPEIEEALIRGLTDGGASAVTLGILPTPAVASLCKKHGGLCGIMVSASHNPPEYNGIKIFDGSGVKLSEEQEGSVEYYIDNPPKKPSKKGTARALPTARDEYIDAVCKATDADFTGLNILLDCGYGASATVAKDVFTRLGANATVENCSLRGEKINSGCGALYPYYVRNSMKGTATRLGFSFDGDADRLSVVFDGEILDGDTVLYNISRDMKLTDNVVVGTVLSNLALEKKLAEDGRRLIRTPVGDKYICDLMLKKNYNLGGEQSGHYIVYPAATTGDGILSAIFFTKSVYKNGVFKALKRLDLCPQKAIAEYADPSIMYEKGMIALIEDYTQKLAGTGRLIVRMSGTEPKIRVMVECADEKRVDEVLAVFKSYITAKKS
ncbi:MAG: phosphoglucosamine mutase [Clostridiales bacterium]|jgi:phosphoglucosamine mutase|nr:phosphoglucosamine mutase [Clostridiales bacterium]